MPESEASKSSGAPRRRRGRRGGRGRTRVNRPAPGVVAPANEASAANAEIAPVETNDAPIAESAAPRRREAVSPDRGLAARDPQALRSAIAQAVAHANEIVQALQQALDQMEEVLELVELADRQKIGDEREIESLRRALRQIQPPRREREERGREREGYGLERERRRPPENRPPEASDETHRANADDSEEAR